VIAGILLAAGAGRRFGGGKLMHPYGPDRTPLALVSYRRLRALVPRVHVILRPGQPELEQVFAAEGAETSVCEQAIGGMGFSLACAVAETQDASGWLVALGDMPQVQAETTRAVLEALEAGASIVIPCHGGRRGHPVGFSAEHRAALLALTGDEGARRVVGANTERVLELAVDDPGILADVDTPEDLQRLERDSGPGTA
jgi:molybdenum cofactor cytidylyltransferase